MRIYDQKYLSVTSVIDLREPFNESSFINWCKRVGKDHALVSATARILGTKVSNVIDNRSRGLEWLTEPPIDMLERRLYASVDNFLKEWTVLETERVVYCEELHYAGRLDGIIKNRDTKYLADWKTYSAWRNKKYKRNSNKIKHARWQLTLYANAIDWEDKLAVVVFKNDGTWELEEVPFDEDMIEWVKDNQEEIVNLINDYNANNKQNKQVQEDVEVL
jgi:hypothetical protein